ncbi:molybdate ABC transporter substrate-binding protein [Rhodovulum tesquicola]|uniref:molybdate ABC transporter substrate-binding protein n=1 Tax=Rhodovulum tesquicola TaxID=540254 RepID=UPI002096812B|nr:molybdate ABC transporter substrate-binding protein [Rhodovulum tesquicola]MCO8146878.1 molybdate ABC transporter substrate-binding protein [Rhodovulum tesquicola]
MMLTRRALGASFLSFGFAVAALPGTAEEAPATIAAASDLRYAVEEIADAFRAETGKEVLLSFGSTGNFARQIREGAPFQMLMAADEHFILDLARDGFTRDEGTLYAEGRVAIAIPADGSTLLPDGTLENLRTALAEGRVTRFAIANPEHAPYGMRAEEVLRHSGLWEALQPILVLGENVSQAAQFALSGNADGGIIAWSLATAPQLRDRGRFALIPAEWHAPLLQRMALVREASPVAEAFYAYIQQPTARAIMERYGFALPE